MSQREYSAGSVPDMFLNAEEVAHLTGKVRRDSQVRALRFMGIEHRVRADGTVVVSRAHVEQTLGVVVLSDRRIPKEFKLKW